MATISTSPTGTERPAAARTLRTGAEPTRGFTLLELVVVLVIVMLLMGVALPMVSARLPGAQLDAAVRQLAAHTRLARNLAVVDDAPVTLIVDVEARRYRLSAEARDHALPATLGVSLYAPESERIDERVGAIRFFGDGSSTGGRVTVSDGTRRRGVDVQWLTGRVSVVD